MKYKIGDIVQIKVDFMHMNEIVKITKIFRSSSLKELKYKIKILKSLGTRSIPLKSFLCEGGFDKYAKKVPLLKAKLYE